MSGRNLILGATGFVGRHLRAALGSDARPLICTSRDPGRARAAHPEFQWARLDVADPASITALLQEGDRIVYLIHAMAGGEGYAQREREGAEALARAARAAGVARIVYLGGPEPPGAPSKHLASRLQTGRILRESGVSTIELRAGMIIGVGSESWRITRDLAVRLPVMLLPRWLRNLCEPIAIADVVAAIAFALDADEALTGAWDIPGPDRLTYQDVIFSVARLSGTRPAGLPVPLLSPRLSSHWLRLVTRADITVARELVDGMGHDLICADGGFFEHMPDYQRTAFEVAARLALKEEEISLPLRTRVVEGLLRRLTRSAAADRARSPDAG